MVSNDGSLDMILSLSLCVRPSALFHIRINFKKRRCLWSFLEEEIVGPSRGLYVRWTRKGQDKTNTYAQIFIRTRSPNVWALLILTPRGNVVDVSERHGVLMTTSHTWKLCGLPTKRIHESRIVFTFTSAISHWPIGFLNGAQCIVCEMWVT